MKSLTYRLTENLHVVGDKVISYTTTVAHIKGDTLYVKGKYSRTTSKHLLLVLSLLKLKIQHIKSDGAKFYKYEEGVKCGMENAISPGLSTTILNRPKGQTILEAIAREEKIKRKDWELIKSHLGLPENLPIPSKQDPMWMPLPEGPRTRAKKK